jgi:hypothetical protein
MIPSYKHLFKGYRLVYACFSALFLVAFTVIMLVTFELAKSPVFEGRTSIWESSGGQAPRWFLFVMGIMWASVNLPVVIAHGVTRRAYFRGAVLAGAVSSVFFAVFILAGFAIERAILADRGLLIDSYRLNSVADFAVYGLQVLLSLLTFTLTGWVVGLLFYRLRAWWATLLLPLAMLPIVIAVFQGPDGDPAAVTPLFAIALALITGAAAFLITRSVPIRNRKA